MGIITKHFRYLLFFCLIGLNLFGQGKARIHEVQAKETLYGIARQYNFTIDDLIFFNPDLKDQDLKVGMKLVIPSDERIAAIKAEREKAIQDSLLYTYHKVQKGETQFSLSQQYGISIEEMRKLNPTMEEQGGLRIDQIVRIPRDPEKHQAFQNEMAALDTGTFKVEGDWFYHRVQRQETAWSLSKRYKISLDSLYLLNPEASNGLLLNQWLKLPKNRKQYRPVLVDPSLPEVVEGSKNEKQQREELERIEDKVDTTYAEGDLANSNYFLYKVKSGDTFFSLKQRYDVSQEELLALNKELQRGLVVGKYIVVPKKNGSRELTWLEKILNDKRESEKNTAVVKSEEIKPVLRSRELSKAENRDTNLIDINKQYRIAIVLPFRSDLYSDTLSVNAFKPHRDTEMATQYYLGFLMAADSLRAMGMSIRLQVFDSHASMKDIPKLARSIDSMQADLVVGPAYGRLVEAMADALREKDIPVISPLSAGVEVKNRTNLYQVVPASSSKYMRIAKMINEHYAEAHIIFAHCGSEAEKQQVQLIKAHLNPRSKNFITSMVSCEELQSRWDLKDRMTENEGTKVVVLLGEDPVFLSDIISKLYVIRDTSITVVGSPRLLNYPTMELSYLNALHYHTYEFRDINYADSATRVFVKDFRANFNAEPGPFAFQAYDAGMYFLPKLWRFGFQFPYHLKAEQKSSTGYEWEQLPEGGWENTHYFMNRLRNFQSQRMDSKPLMPEKVEGLSE
ncbi:LysM peptidoglycan-binding domain-containing protein [Croceimicrobium sp.]|uniref:LysM peptidoglycan-binding domain-containing protein n=1 Tax=Croceimicrobium sp. TaxID=2828340 RepID=UPI003BA98D35